MNGLTVHVRTDGPRGWIGRVTSTTGSVLTIVAATNGARRLVDTSRVEVRPM